MIKRIHHVGIAVENLDEVRTFFSTHFKMPVSDQERFGELLFSFCGIDGSDLEFLQSTTPNGIMAKFIDRRGPGVHHVTLEVDDIQSELDRLKGEGIRLINEVPYENAHNDLVAFIHPKSTFGILFELIQPAVPHGTSR